MTQDNKDLEDTTYYCSFCGKSRREVRKLIAGPSVFICNECVVLCQDILREETDDGVSPASLRGKYVYELLQSHFKTWSLEEIASCSCLFSSSARQQIEAAITDWLQTRKDRYKFVGIGARFYKKRLALDFPTAWEHEAFPFYVGPTQYELPAPDATINERCLKNGLWLCSAKSMRYAILLDARPADLSTAPEGVYVEMAATPGKGAEAIEELFAFINAVLMPPQSVS